MRKDRKKNNGKNSANPTVKKNTSGAVEQSKSKFGATLWPLIVREIVVAVIKSLVGDIWPS
jgi:hypothetical protein